MTIARRFLFAPVLAAALALTGCATATPAAEPAGESVAPSAPSTSVTPSASATVAPEPELARIVLSATGIELRSLDDEVVFAQRWTDRPDLLVEELTRHLGAPTVGDFTALTMHTPDGTTYGWIADDDRRFSIDEYHWGDDPDPTRERTSAYSTATEVDGVVIESADGVRVQDPFVWDDSDPFWREELSGVRIALVAVSPMSDDERARMNCDHMCGDGVRVVLEQDRVASLSAPRHGVGPVS